MKKKILVVDDNPQMREFVADLLEEEGHQIVTAEDGLSAIDKLMSFVPDIMFVDLVMPKIGGDKLCKLVRKMHHLQDCYLVLLSAAAAEMDFDYRGVGADACIAKGPIGSVVGHILAAVRESDSIQKGEDPLSIKGLDDVHHRQMTKELISQYRHLGAVLDTISEGILEIFSDRIVYANSTALSLFNRSHENLLSVYLPDLFDDKAKPKVKKVLASSLEKPFEIDRKEAVRINDKDVTLKKIPVKGEEAADIIMITDVTARIRAENKIQKAHDEMEQKVNERTTELMKSNQQLHQEIHQRQRIEEELLKVKNLESIGILAGGIAHDFNNLLSIIVGNIELAKYGVEPVSETSEFIAEVENACFQAKELANQLITFSKGGTPVKRTGKIKDLLQTTSIHALSGSDVKCEYVLPEDLWPVELDEDQMKHAIKNLIVNAIESMPHGGSINVHAENVGISLEAAKQSLGLSEGKYVKISIQDQGTGISEEHLSMIFDPYFTTKEMGIRKGLGLGLTTTYSIINSHDGCITVESEVGIGTIFTIFLPVIEKTTAGLEPVRKRRPGKPAKPTRRILIMDDEEMVRKVSKQMLIRLGYEPETAQDGLEAVEMYKKAKESGRPFGVVIVDLTVKGGMGGRDAFKSLHEIDPQVIAIVSSGYSNDPVMTDYQKYGFSGALPKPYRMEDLGEVLISATKE